MIKWFGASVIRQVKQNTKKEKKTPISPSVRSSQGGRKCEARVDLSLARPLPSGGQLGKYAFLRDELVVCTLLRNLAFVHDEDPVAHPHNG